MSPSVLQYGCTFGHQMHNPFRPSFHTLVGPHLNELAPTAVPDACEADATAVFNTQWELVEQLELSATRWGWHAA